MVGSRWSRLEKETGIKHTVVFGIGWGKFPPLKGSRGGATKRACSFTGERNSGPKRSPHRIPKVGDERQGDCKKSGLLRTKLGGGKALNGGEI